MTVNFEQFLILYHLLIKFPFFLQIRFECIVLPTLGFQNMGFKLKDTYQIWMLLQDMGFRRVALLRQLDTSWPIHQPDGDVFSASRLEHNFLPDSWRSDPKETAPVARSDLNALSFRAPCGARSRPSHAHRRRRGESDQASPLIIPRTSSFPETSLLGIRLLVSHRGELVQPLLTFHRGPPGLTRRQVARISSGSSCERPSSVEVNYPTQQRTRRNK